MATSNPTRGGGGMGGARRAFQQGRKRKAPATETPVITPGRMTPVSAMTSGAATPNTIGSTIASAGTNVRFSSFSGLNPELLKNIPFEFCTEVQAATLPAIIANKDVLAQAKTGTGKTLAFLIPSIQRLMAGRAPAQPHTSILVLSPTRELASQIADAAKKLLPAGMGVQCVVGGTNMATDVKNLRSGRADVLVATPGRLVDLLENANMKPRFAQLSTLVLDEADRLLDQGFRRELIKILDALPQRAAVPRQTLLFSATLPAEVHSISSIALSPDHEFISTLKDEDINAHKHVVQEVAISSAHDLIATTVEVLRREESLAAERGGFKVMVFLPTARAAGLYYDIFTALKTSFPVWEIHSRMSQSKRTKATDQFRASPNGVLFSSDVTARGIDVQGVTGVVQVGLPSSGEQYVHRLGRTARAGAQGHGVLVLGEFEKFFLNDKTIRTFDLAAYPAIDPASLQAVHQALAGALAQVSEESKAQAYQAWLGYYNSNLRNLKWSSAELVAHANDYAQYCLQTRSDGGEWRAPGLLAKTVGKMGLKGVPGLNVVRALPNEGGAPGGGQGGRGGQQQRGPKPDGGAQNRQQQPRQPSAAGGPGGPGGGARGGRPQRGGRGGGRGGRGGAAGGAPRGVPGAGGAGAPPANNTFGGW